MNKYLKGGSINPVWVNEQEVNKITDNIMGAINTMIKNTEFSLNMELLDGINFSISNNKRKEMVRIVADDKLSNYENKFNFIKNHSDNPEDLKLAREIVGL